MRFVSVPLLLAWATIAAAQNPPQNLDFEAPELITRDIGWSSPMSGYRAEIWTENVKEGKACARLSSLETHRLSPFGNLMQVWDAKPYRGQRIKVRGAVRTDLPDGPHTARLWLRIDLTGDRTGFQDNMSRRKIAHPDWRYYEMIADVPDDAVTINFGMMLITRGQAWLDDVSITTIPVTAPVLRTADVQSLENLVAFTRLLGYVRFFHPSDKAARLDWNAFATAGVLAVESARDATQLAERLNELFAPIAPTVAVWSGGAEPPLHGALAPDSPDTLGLIRWEHHGPGACDAASPFRSERRRLAPGTARPAGWPAPQQPFQVELVDGVSCRVPRALFTDGDATSPSVPGLWQPPSARADDRAARIAAVMLTWSTLQHFYPHFEAVDVDWSAALRESLTAAAADTDTRTGHRTLRQLISQLADGQARISHPNLQPDYTLPLNWTWVGESLVITHVEPSLAAGPQPGDIVTRIDGRSVAERRAVAERLISAATPGLRAHYLLTELSRWDAAGETTLEVRTASGPLRTVRVARSSATQAWRASRPAPFTELRPGILYVDCDRVRDDDFATALPQLAQAKGIVFDLRGEAAQLSLLPLQYLLAEPGTTPPSGVPVITQPDRTAVAFARDSTPLSPLTPRLSGKLAFVTDGRTRANAEEWTMIVEQLKLGAIVGAPTAGACGDVATMTLPAGYEARFTATRVLKHDGSRLHGVGVRPTVPAELTIAGIAAGRDEQLEHAIQIVTTP